MTSPSLVCDEVLHWTETYTGPKFHAMVGDPPYHLTPDVRGVTRYNGACAEQWRSRKATSGFMGKKWDCGDIAFRPETWKALAQHLLPGAFGLCFASARGWHRLACAIEDAGLIMHPSVFMLGWATGMGFPKSTKIDDERFSGHRYGLQAMKPALEPVICFQKPYQGSPQACITATGAGALWIDGARIGAQTDTRRRNGESPGGFPHNDDAWMPHRAEAGHIGKRWPPNLALLHLPTCTPLSPQQVPGVQAYDCAPGCPVAAFDRQAGERTTGLTRGNGSRSKLSGTTYANDPPSRGMPSYDGGYGYTGPASRFMMTADWALDVAEQLAQEGPVFYTGKASRGERDEGLLGLLQPGHAQRYRSIRQHPGAGYPEGSLARNPHPTVKPIALCQWLATLLLPPAAYAPRRLLNPFAGSGSEAIGATLAGWEEVVGIEQDPATVAVGTRRLAWWTTQIAAQLSLWP